MGWAVSLSTTDLITRSLTPRDEYLAFGVYLNSVTRDGPLVQTVLYLHHSHSEAIPKYISERTSYLQVRLEFLRYPHVIQTFFNMSWFGPPVRLTAPSTCTWVGHLVSGRRHLTHALFRLAFAAAPSLQLNLACNRNSPVHSTKGTPSPINGL